MAINIDKLSEAELTDLNHRIVARLKRLRETRAHAAVLEFNIGERVSFQPDGHSVLLGIISKCDQESVTVITESTQHWTVAPVILRKLSAPADPSASRGQVIPLPKK